MAKRTTKKSKQGFLGKQFLIAMPSLDDPNFERSVTFLCEHDADGAMGIVINRPLDMSLRELFDHLNIPLRNGDDEKPVIAGGPMQTERGFVLHRTGGEWLSTWQITPDIAITSSPDVLQAMGEGLGPDDAFVALGYAGWGPGQLEAEIAANAWLHAPLDAAILFDTPIEKRWQAAVKLLGIDIAFLSGQVGHS